MTPIGLGAGISRTRLRASAMALLLGLLGATVSSSVRAEVSVAGTASAVRVRAMNDSVASVLSVLATTLGVHFTTSIALDEIVSGNYSGSLREVISDLLRGRGYNYVIHEDHGAIEILVLGKAGAEPAAAARAAAPATFAAQWR
jgi:hypothetical protein